MRYTSQIKPVSYLKTNAAKILQELQHHRRPLIITQNGDAKAVIQDVVTYEETQELLALLKILVLGNRQVEEGKVTPVGDALQQLRVRAKSSASR